jgi:hypothetical protein
VDALFSFVSELKDADREAREAAPFRVGTVTATAPLTVTIDGGSQASLGTLSTYTPTIGHTVLVGVVRGITSVQYVVLGRIV